MNYVLRLQAMDGYASKFSNVFSDRFSRVIYVQHRGKEGTNLHYHFCFTCDYKKQALRVYLKGHFDSASGNKHLSLKDWDGNIKACSYLFHEGTPVTSLRGFSEEEIDSFKTLNLQTKSTQIKIPVLLENVIARLISYRNNDHDFSQDSYFTPDPVHDHRNIFNLILDELRKKGDWVPNRPQMERYINKVRLMLVSNPREFRDFQNNLYNEMFSRF